MRDESPRQNDQNGGKDEFDHFFADRGGSGEQTDPDATAWAGPPQTDAGRPGSAAPPPGPSYARPADSTPYDEYEPGQHYPDAQGGGYYQEPKRRGSVWAPVAVIVASLAVVAAVIAIILNNSGGHSAGGPASTATVTRTASGTSAPSSTQTSQDSASSTSSSSSSSSESSSSESSSSSSSQSSSATALPDSAASCNSSDQYGTGSRTTCEFAGVVDRLYEANKDDSGDATFRAESPATHKKYDVSCRADSYVTCTTDTGAVVYILRS